MKNPEIPEGSSLNQNNVINPNETAELAKIYGLDDELEPLHQWGPNVRPSPTPTRESWAGIRSGSLPLPGVAVENTPPTN